MGISAGHEVDSASITTEAPTAGATIDSTPSPTAGGSSTGMANTSASLGSSSDGTTTSPTGDSGSTGNVDVTTIDMPVCGDGVIEGAEECDDGNDIDDDACTNSCTEPRCGDMIIQAGEACDDGDDDDSDDCVAGCIAAVCGDGYIHNVAEACDDGNSNDLDACSNNCSVNVVEYSASFIGGQFSVDQCTAWDAFRASIGPGPYSQVIIRGSQDPVGVKCVDEMAADDICQSLKTGKSKSIKCSGQDWIISACGAGIEFSYNVPACGCNDPVYVVRPCAGGSSWGAIKGPSCNPKSQTIEVLCK